MSLRAEQPTGWDAEGKGGSNECRLVLVANKADLLPTKAAKNRLEVGLARMQASAKRCSTTSEKSEWHVSAFRCRIQCRV